MPTWVKAAIGLAVALVVLAVAREIFTYGPGATIKWKDGEITVNPRSTASPASKTAESLPSPMPVQPVECEQEWSADSGWRRGGSSPSQFCGGEMLKREAEFPGRKVRLTTSSEDHRVRYDPFKRDQYRYKCSFVDTWQPLDGVCPNS